MKKQATTGKPTLKDLEPRATGDVRGQALSSAISDVMKNFGGALSTAARG